MGARPGVGVDGVHFPSQARLGAAARQRPRRRFSSQRAGGLAVADFTAGLLAAIAALAGLASRQSGPSSGLGQTIEVSLLGAALAVRHSGLSRSNRRPPGRGAQ
jgi:crotonobetainyl-CoA:carnitine CoA-transferase CaiB-like acyl-CoA transferase